MHHIKNYPLLTTENISLSNCYCVYCQVILVGKNQDHCADSLRHIAVFNKMKPMNYMYHRVPCPQMRFSGKNLYETVD